MKNLSPDDILRLRLENQALARARFRKPEEVAAWFGAVQAQDYLGSLWALGQRMPGATEKGVEEAERRRAIVRTWPLRGTLHFVAAEDSRWLTRLLSPRIVARNAARWKREFDVDGKSLARADDVLTRALEGGKRQTRDQLYAALDARRIRTSGSRGLHLLLCLSLQGRLCLAGREGKQHTFALLDDWIPDSRVLTGEEALAELARRYFTSHGPATLADFTWWAGLTVKDARAAIDSAGRELTSGECEGKTYWWREPATRGRAARAPQVRLLPAFDEYTVAYQDRALLLTPGVTMPKMALLNPAVLVDGRVTGSWKRTLKGKSVTIAVRLNRRLSAAERSALGEEVDRLGEFLGLEARLT